MRLPTTLTDSAAGRFKTNPDIIYFPAVRKDGPANLVLLCTVLLREKDGRFQAVHNDGRCEQLAAHHLILALQRTYTYIGADEDGCPETVFVSFQTPEEKGVRNLF